MRIDPYGRLSLLSEKKKREDELSRINDELKKRDSEKDSYVFKANQRVENFSLKRTVILNSNDGIVYLVEKEQKKL